MRTLGKIAATLSVIGAIGTTSVIPAAALDVYVGHPYHRHYYDYYRGGGWNSVSGCRPGWTRQGGVCKPYQGPVGPGWGWYR